MSTIRVDNATPQSGGTEYSLTQGVSKANGRFNGETNTINYSVNTSSLTDDSVGNFTLQWTNPFTSITDYLGVGSTHDTLEFWMASPALLLQSGLGSQYSVASVSGVLQDSEENTFAYFGNLL